MIDLLLAASLSTALPGAPVAPVEAKPAMFVVHDADTTIYIFGTFHALDGDADWFSGNLKAAFNDAQELVLETLVPEGPRALAPSPVAAQVGSGYSAASSASFLTSTRVALSAERARGMNVANGADMVLRHVAEAQGKPVEGLETLDAQFRMFDRLAAIAPRPARSATVPNAGTAKLPTSMSDMQAAWRRGDQFVFARLIEQIRKTSPDSYRMMFADRNTRWADWIAARLRTPGAVFVAVGAGHLAGRDSVLVRLAERGIESSRLN